MKYSFISGALTGFVVAYGLMIGFSYAHQESEFVISRDEVVQEDIQEDEGFVLSRHEVAAKEGRRVSRTTICNDCMDGMGKILYDISYLSAVLADVQEKLLDTVYGYAKKKKTGFLAEGSRSQLGDFHTNLMDVHAKATDAIVSANQLIALF